MAKTKNSARQGSARAGSEAAGARPKRTKPSSKRAPAVKEAKAAKSKGFTPALGQALCDRMATQSRSLRQVCSDPDMPSKTAVLKWLDQGSTEGAPEDKRAFVAQYTRAREALADSYVDSTAEISDEGMRDAEQLEAALVSAQGVKIETVEKDGETTVAMVDPEVRSRFVIEAFKARQDARRMQIDSRKWAAGKIAPKKYGSKFEDGMREVVGDSLAALIGSIDGKTRSL